jgi:hypothetical protein
VFVRDGLCTTTHRRGAWAVAGAAFKKQKKLYQADKVKAEKAAAAAAKKARPTAREVGSTPAGSRRDAACTTQLAEDDKRLEEARKVTIVEDPALPAAKRVRVRA